MGCIFAAHGPLQHTVRVPRVRYFLSSFRAFYTHRNTAWFSGRICSWHHHNFKCSQVWVISQCAGAAFWTVLDRPEIPNQAASRPTEPQWTWANPTWQRNLPSLRVYHAYEWKTNSGQNCMHGPLNWKACRLRHKGDVFFFFCFSSTWLVQT